ncbi:serine/threonine protein kinase [Comamonas flocculans]|uniref:Stress response kinase A n=1 Tax=Comamonas flocculans TaxID=2597701 RepID=A0A5B8RZ88_9BURK|nr:serine/threonine protein kinase [Comamonas flocculans]QEA13515.1 serine/threonine protein kinase [Comamonas flocculans]
MAEAGAHAYAALTPDVVLDALAACGLQGDGRLMALGSYENRVYQVGLDDGSRVVAKFYRPGRWSAAQIGEEHAFAGELAAAEVPMVAPLALAGQTLHQHAGFAFSVSPWRGGRMPELDDFEVLEWLGRFIARLHLVGERRPFTQRPRLDLQSFALEPRDWLLAHEAVAPEVRGAWREVVEEAIEEIAAGAGGTGVAARFGLQDAQLLRVHGDCHPGNVLWTPVEEAEGGPHFVDLDDARMGPAVQDLWMLLSGERRQRTLQLSALLDGYEQVRAFDRRELALIEPLRTLRLIHYSAWLARRWGDPTFPIHFPWFGSGDYWRGQVALLREQVQALREPPLMA